MKGKCTVGIIFGGKSAEHDVSITSTASILNNIDRHVYMPVLIYVDRNGGWHHVEPSRLSGGSLPEGNGRSFLPWETESIGIRHDIDIYFPMIHGPNGEDGKIQGLLELAGKPYVGANGISSALAMDKVISKILFQKSRLQTPEFLYFVANQPEHIADEVEKNLAYPVFVKPASLGSSVGIKKVKDRDALAGAVEHAFTYDRKIIIEQGIDAREIEVSVMGNREIQVSKPGELVPNNEFYDYQDKYIDGKTTFHIPADLPKTMVSKVQAMAREAFRSHFLNGMARIDFLLERGTGQLFINEINTIPGFTEISMFAKLWELEGFSFRELISKLIELGFDFIQSDPSNESAFTRWEKQ